MPRLTALLCACLLACAAPACAEDDAETRKLRAELAQLRSRVQTYQKQVQDLQRSLGQTAQRDDALKERLEQREAELGELRAKVKALLPNTDRYPELAQLVEGFEADPDLRKAIEALSEATGVEIRVHRSVPKDAALALSTCDLQLIQVLELVVKNARGADGERLTLAWTWRASRGVEVRAVSKE